VVLKVNPKDWELLSIEDQEKTRKIISTFFKDQSIELDPGAGRLSALPAEEALCETLCDAAMTAAIISCAGEPVCTSLAIAGGRLCKEAC
jgi:hypothetical protein